MSDDDTTVRLTESEALANLHAVLQLCAAGKLRCSENTTRPGAATVTAVAAVLAGGDFYADEAIAAFAWPLLLQAGGLAELAGGRLQLTAKGRTALGKPPAETVRQLWRRWVSNAPIDEFSRIEEIKGQRSANALSSAKSRRKTVAVALAGCSSGEWITIDSLFASMRARGLSPDVARSERGLWRLYISDPQYGSLGYAGYHHWSLLEGRYTLAVLFEYAATLGLFDLEYGDPRGARTDFHGNWGAEDLDFLSRYDGLHAIRPNALGDYVFGRSDRYVAAAEVEAGDLLKVLPNLDIVATGNLSPVDRLVLDSHAKQTSDRVWTMSVASLLAAVDTGRPVEEFAQFLLSRTGHELPSGVTTALEDARNQAAQLRDLGVARLVECADPALAALITRDRALRGMCRPVGDRHLAIPVEQEATFRKAVQKLGYVLSADSVW